MKFRLPRSVLLSQAAFSRGRFWMVMLAISLKDSFLLASRISIPTTCLFSSRSIVMPSSMSTLSSTCTSLSWMYRASASLSYSILKSNHLHPFFFFTAVKTTAFSSVSTYVTLKYFSGSFFQAFSRVSEKVLRNPVKEWPIQSQIQVSYASAFCFLRVVCIGSISFYDILADAFLVFNQRILYESPPLWKRGRKSPS